jgi:hypothetical protein
MIHAGDVAKEMIRRGTNRYDRGPVKVILYVDTLHHQKTQAF